MDNHNILWTLGISSAQHTRSYDKECRTHPDLDEDHYESTLTITSRESIYQLVTKLCSGPVCDRREYGAQDSSPTDHLWELHVVPAGMCMGDVGNDDYILRKLMRGEDEEEEEEQPPQTELCVGPDQESADIMFRDMPEGEFVRRVYKDTKVSELRALEVGGTIYLKYDMG